MVTYRGGPNISMGDQIFQAISEIFSLPRPNISEFMAMSNCGGNTLDEETEPVKLYILKPWHKMLLKICVNDNYVL